MKRLMIYCILSMFAVSLNAQIKTATKEDIERFLKSTTYVVLEGDPFSSFNAFVDEGLKNAWKITPYEIISTEDFEKKCSDPNSSFLMVAEARFSETRSSLFRSNSDILNDNDTYTYDILTLVMGDRSKYLNQMPDLATVPIAYSAIEDKESSDYKMGLMVNFMQFYVKFCSNNPGKDIRALEKENAGKAKNYELWLRKEELAPEVNTIEQIKKVYPYPVKLVTIEEISKAIKEKNPRVAVLHKVGPEGSVQGDAKCWKFIVTAAEGNPLYFDSHRISSSKPDAFLEDDFKKLAK